MDPILFGLLLNRLSSTVNCFNWPPGNRKPYRFRPISLEKHGTRA